MKRHTKTQSSEAEVNMTPLLDIVFIMLIFFIVSSSFVSEKGLNVTSHKNDNETEDLNKQTKSIILKICSNRNVMVDGRSIDARSVRANVERKLAEDNAAIVIIESEMEAPTETLALVIDQAHAANAVISVSPNLARCSAGNFAVN